MYDPFIPIYPRPHERSEASEGDFSPAQQWNTKLQRLTISHSSKIL